MDGCGYKRIDRETEIMYNIQSYRLYLARKLYGGE